MEHRQADGISVRIRLYTPADAAVTLAVFLAAVTETASADYTPEQVHAWARPDKRDVGTWNLAMLARGSVVATIGEEVVGFSDVSPSGYVDMMFVSPHHQRRGVAQRLLGHIEEQARSARIPVLSADVSVTARRFFERSGFIIEAEQHPVTAGAKMTNYKMRKELQ